MAKRARSRGTAPVVAGGCDAYSSDRTTLALVRVVNRGSDTSYIGMCGPSPALNEQRLIDGQWSSSRGRPWLV